MTELLVVLVAALVVIAATTLIGPRLGIASPLVLVAIGVGASFLPVFAGVHIDPEWILEGVLPPLLYSSAVSIPAMNFRREFGAISGLSVLLVVGSALLLGLFFMLVIPGLGFAWGVALGAIVSPTDAVATSIIKRTSVSKRVVAMLDGESLLNDATALVLLRTATAATALGFSFWGALGTFAYSVVDRAADRLAGRLAQPGGPQAGDGPDGQHRHLLRGAVRRLGAGRLPRGLRPGRGRGRRADHRDPRAA